MLVGVTEGVVDEVEPLAADGVEVIVELAESLGESLAASLVGHVAVEVGAPLLEVPRKALGPHAHRAFEERDVGVGAHQASRIDESPRYSPLLSKNCMKPPLSTWPCATSRTSIAHCPLVSDRTSSSTSGAPSVGAVQPSRSHVSVGRSSSSPSERRSTRQSNGIAEP